MAPSDTAGETSGLSPHEAYDIVGDQTRLQILEALGEAADPLAFSELFDRIEYSDTGNFSYHLQTLEGHFIRKTADGYLLNRAGARIVEAILSGAVTDAPVIERTPAGRSCFLCGGAMELSYKQETVRLFCSDCGGTRDSASDTAGQMEHRDSDVVGGVGLPPAGVQGRSPDEVIEAAEIWSVAQSLAATRGVCPRCAAPLERSVRVCDDHDASTGHCESCHQRFRVTTITKCRNCIYGSESVFTSYLLGTMQVMAFLIDHGIDPIHPKAAHLRDFEEHVHSVDPFEGQFTLSIDGEALTLTIDETLSVTEVVREDVSKTE